MITKLKKIIKNMLGRGISELEYLEAHGFRHGKNFQYYSGHPIDSNWPWLISVGDNVMLASDVRILAHDASTGYTGARTKIGCVTIGNNVFIGADSIVLCNTKIGDNVIVGVGSVVTNDLPSNGVYAGNPAKYICSFEEYKKKHMVNAATHPCFTEHKWDEWSKATPEEWGKMRERLKDTFGYV